MFVWIKCYVAISIDDSTVKFVGVNLSGRKNDMATDRFARKSRYDRLAFGTALDMKIAS
jgi:hypothetical protein